MGDHHTNLMALLARTIPQFPPDGRYCQISIAPKAAPKRNVLLALPENIREHEGARQFRKGDDGGWETPKEGTVLHPIGTPLPFELCDVAFVLVSAWVNTMVPDPVKAQGFHVLPGELGRVDLLQFMRRSEATIGEKPLLVVAS